MREQWEVACEAQLPIIVHNRDSNEVMLQTVKRPEFSTLRGVFHSFAGGLEMAQELLDLGYTLGMSGMVTFRAADNVREVLPLASDKRILVETDTPYLAPVPYRGQPNEPAYLVEVVKRLAVEMVSTPGEIAAATTRNFFELFTRARWQG
jgi:TatD DNase family protein